MSEEELEVFFNLTPLEPFSYCNLQQSIEKPSESLSKLDTCVTSLLLSTDFIDLQMVRTQILPIYHETLRALSNLNFSNPISRIGKIEIWLKLQEALSNSSQLREEN